MNLFYIDPKEIRPPQITIKGQEAKHISKVMRYEVSDRIMLTDGLGTMYDCEIMGIDKDGIHLEIRDKDTEERKKPFLTICIGNIKKRDRLEFSVEKMTELGVDRIVVFNGEYSQKEKVRLDRLEAAALAAMKQSLRLYLPRIVVEKSLQSALALLHDQEQLLMADESSDQKNRSGHAYSDFDSIFIVIGPEGGFSENERGLLTNLSAGIVSLGAKRLRTETAAVVAADRLKNRF